MSPQKICLISDSHNKHGKIEIPKCDILIHCGDMTGRGTRTEVLDFLSWFVEQPASSFVLIAGNHDWLFEKEPLLAKAFLMNFGFNELGTNKYYLEDNLAIVNGIKIYGSPYQPWFHSWAFNLHRGPDLARKWSTIPDELDILITHGPPAGIGDLCQSKERVGCVDLLDKIKKIKVKFHCFGHIHEAYGSYQPIGLETTFINCSICDERYKPVNKPIIIEI